MTWALGYVSAKSLRELVSDGSGRRERGGGRDLHCPYSRAGTDVEDSLDVWRYGCQEELVVEEDGEIVMADVNRLQLLLVIGCEVLGSMPITVICTTLNGSVFEDAGRY
jgi:hypothetical protein